MLADDQVRAIQHRKLTEAGWTPESIRALATPRPHALTAPDEADVAELYDHLAGPLGLTEQSPTFTLREIHQAVAAWAVDRLDAEQIAALAERFLADPRVVRLHTSTGRRRNLPDPAYTTVELLEAEDNLVALYRQGRVDRGGPPRATLDAERIEAAISTHDALLRDGTDDQSGGLADEQANVVRRVLSSADLIRPVVGPAGTGKTEAMRAAAVALLDAGHTVFGTANGGRQAEELGERLNVETRVVSAWLTLLDHAPDPATVWPPGTVLFVDEATQVSTRDAERLLRYATRTGAAVVLVGDPAQLGSVGAGGWFAHLITLTGDAPSLTLNQRQRGPRLAEVRAALTALRVNLPDQTRAALDRLARDDRIRVFDSPEDLLAQVVEDWHVDRRTQARAGDQPKRPAATARMMAEHHRDTDLLNRAARARLRADAVLHGPTLLVAGREFQAGDEVITLTQAGHTLVPAGRPRSAYIRTGAIGHVIAVHADPAGPRRQALTVHFPGKGDVRIGWDYLTHAFPDGRDGGLAHAYALTAHKAEGATLPTTRAVVADDTSAPGLYVMLSRARHDLRAYLIRRRDLEADLEADLDDEDWLPVLRDPAGPLRRLLDHLEQSRPERLAHEHDPTAQAAHQLQQRHTLAELRQLRLNTHP